MRFFCEFLTAVPDELVEVSSRDRFAPAIRKPLQCDRLMTPQDIMLIATVTVWSAPFEMPVKILSCHIHFLFAVLT